MGSSLVSSGMDRLAKRIDERKARSLNNGHSQKIVFMKEIS
ncbi:MAG: hypothetical protein QXV17_14485 [Candidatus Micrarchaeaceae archaeon]